MSVSGDPNQDLLNLLTVLYQGSVQKSSLALPPTITSYPGSINSALFFHIDDIPTLAADLNLTLPADIQSTLKVGLSQGVFQRSALSGTLCHSFDVCRPTTAANFVSPPVLIYAYNPSMLRVNPRNSQLLALGQSPFASFNQSVHGSVVKWSNHREPFFGKRGSATWERSTYKAYKFASNKCCRG
jgi:hypothetical protein